ncbi:HAD hydrolase family protein [Candidatus Saccharibacteria bacterium]|nr:MAG: HAD hydrolase family protein [Candidatus Saccharibacteria bacterium]
MKPKLIIFDLDGTAIPNIPNGLPSNRLVQTIADSKEFIRLSAATGRPITNAKPILDKLNLDEPCIISAGTQIINPHTDEVVWEILIDPKDVQAVLKLCKPYDFEILVRNELLGEGAPARSRNLEGPINVMYAMHCSEKGSELLKQLDDISGITAAGVLSWTGEGLDIHITNKLATKEHAIAELLTMLGISRDETMGVGDGNNDVHLFRGVGMKVAMGNATDLLKSQADFVCKSVDEDGLADLIFNSVSDQFK